MKYIKLAVGSVMAFNVAAFAMPTQEDTKKVEPLVMDLMKDDQVALKSGKKSRVEVAESAMSLADKADSEAAKLLLIKGAFNLYVRAGEFDKAIETLQALQAAIPDMPPANMASIIESSLRVVPRKNGGQLYRLLDETKLQMRYTSAAKSIEKSVKQNPADRALRTKLAEHYAYLGQWDKALENFQAADGNVGVIAKSERDGDATEKVADFWWAYPNGKAEELVRAFRAHAAKLYEDAIAAGKITGLNKVQAERRIEETKEYGDCNLIVTSDAKQGLYCVVDLTGGPGARKYPISYLNDIPKDGWTDEYKTTKLVLRKIYPGSFEYFNGKRFTITSPYFIGVFEVTQKQYELVCGERPSRCVGEMRPVDNVTYKMIRGNEKGLLFPQTDDVDLDSFLGRIRRRTNERFDLPTEVQWEYACRAGTKSFFNNGGAIECDMAKLGRCENNGGDTNHTSVVGAYLPNKWGLYDMHGNVWELCRDLDGNDDWEIFGWDKYPKDSTVDPVSRGGKKSCIRRGGSWRQKSRQCTSSTRGCVRTDIPEAHLGFRLVIGPDLVSEWRVRQKK